MGGGYRVFKTAALWALAWAKFCGIEPHDHYAGIVSGMMYSPEAQSGSMEDMLSFLEWKKKQACMAYARDVVHVIREALFSMHGIKVCACK